MELNVKVQQVTSQLKPEPKWNPNSGNSAKKAWLDAERRAGRKSGLD
jgi:hypothetical protein